MSELRIQLEAERAEARKAKMEASSTTKQFEQLVQRLRREADASKSWMKNLACCSMYMLQRDPGTVCEQLIDT
jgi:hypothetical protein